MMFRLCWIFLLFLGIQAQDTKRGIQAEGLASMEVGRFHFLGIGIDHYQDERLNLSTSTHGARALRDLLIERYTFERADCKLLLDARANRAGIIEALRDLAHRASPNDSVLIYYAGHGNLDKLTKIGSWVPWDANWQKPSVWIGNSEIKNLIKAMKARHVLLISDSCFAGDFFRGKRDTTTLLRDKSLRQLYMRNSRRAMTAGGVEPVADGGQDGHSVYTWWLLKILRESTDPYLLPEDIHERLRKAVSANADQHPQEGSLYGAGGEPDAAFVFFQRGIEDLEEAMAAQDRELQALAKLERDMELRRQRQQTWMRQKRQEYEEREQQIAELRRKLGSDSAADDLDQILADLETKRKEAEELEAERLRLEQEMAVREAELAEERRKLDERREQAFLSDLGKFHRVAVDDFAPQVLKQRAWEILCRQWSVPEETPYNIQLSWHDGQVVVGKLSDFPVSQPRPPRRTTPGMTPIHGEKRVFKMGDVSIPMIFLAGGSFIMGSPPDVRRRNRDEVQHQVTLSQGFWIGETEVTQAQWKALIGKNPSHFKGASLPVDSVSWGDAQHFVQKLNVLFHEDAFRLPTEAQWEYACRAGSLTPWSFGDDENELARYAIYWENAERRTHKVKSKLPNAWGIYDMHGNVFEWCADRYGHYPKTAVTDPTGHPSGKQMVLRGGGWYKPAWDCQSANREAWPPKKHGPGVGFRIVKIR